MQSYKIAVERPNANLDRFNLKARFHLLNEANFVIDFGRVMQTCKLFLPHEILLSMQNFCSFSIYFSLLKVFFLQFLNNLLDFKLHSSSNELKNISEKIAGWRKLGKDEKWHHTVMKSLRKKSLIYSVLEKWCFIWVMKFHGKFTWSSSFIFTQFFIHSWFLFYFSNNSFIIFSF